jgi:DNA-binding LytR/AlgR family response regulator
MNMYNILIVEDDILQRRNLRTMLEELGDTYTIFEADNEQDGYNIALTQDINLFYFDINLVMGSGLELAKKIREIEKYKLTWIVFLTSFMNYIIEAFKEVHCYDYIMKPIEKNILHEMTKALVQGNDNKYEQNEEAEKEHLFVNMNGILIKINIMDTFFIETYRKITFIHTIQGIYEIKNLSLVKLLNSISSKDVIQSHKSYAINIKNVLSINKKTSCWEISFNNYDKIALLGDKYRSTIMDLWKII